MKHNIFYVCWNQGTSSGCIRIGPTHAGPKRGGEIETLPIEGSLQIKYDYVHLNVSYDIFDFGKA